METLQRDCSACGKPATDPHRKLCWSCTNYKTRYGEGWQVVRDMKRGSQRTLCYVCYSPRKYCTTIAGMPICAKCSEVASFVGDPAKMERLKSFQEHVKLGDLG
jgi:hypothetical protein